MVVDRRVVLVALWAAFAVASVGVGFAAAGLVGHPFTDASSTVAVEGSTSSSTASSSSSTPDASTPANSSTPTTPTGTGTPKGTTGPKGTKSGSPATSAEPKPVVRGFNTRGGYVSASCRDGLVAVSASPAVGWRLDGVTSGRVVTADVEFRSGDLGVEVSAVCSGGLPRFSLDDRGGGGGGGGGGGHGGDDTGGSGGGGSDDSGGSGSGGGDG